MKINIDFIKWMFELAGNNFSIKIIDGELWIDYIGFSVPVSCYDSWVFKPLILQRVVEEINDNYEIRFWVEHKYKEIQVLNSFAEILKRGSYRNSDNLNTIDEAKTIALEYIHKQVTE